MAFPTIQTADTQSNHVTSNSNSWTLTYPTNLASGDLILCFMAIDGAPSATFPADWIKTGDFGSGAIQRVMAKKISLGSESGNFTVSLGATEQGSWIVYRITGWEGTIGADFGNGASSGAVVSNNSVQSSSNTPDPPNLDPATWATEDTLWFAGCAVDTSRTVSIFPLPDNQYSDPSGGSNGATLAVCTTNSAVSALDPGTFTISASDDWIGMTVAVRPAADVPVVYVPRHPAHDYGSVTNF